MKVLVADPIAQSGIDIIKKTAEVDVKTKLSEEQLVNIIGDYDALVVRSQTQVTANVINAGHKLTIIGRAGVGVDNIDVSAATERGIIVANAPTGNTVSAAEHAIALMLAWPVISHRLIILLNPGSGNGQILWERKSREKYLAL